MKLLTHPSHLLSRMTLFNPNQRGGGGPWRPPYHIFAYSAQNYILDNPDTSWLFLTIRCSHFKPFLRSLSHSVWFLWLFSSRWSWILPKGKFSWQFFPQKSRFWNGCRIHNFLRKRLGKVAMSQILVVINFRNGKWTCYNINFDFSMGGPWRPPPRTETPLKSPHWLGLRKRLIWA